MGDRAIVHFTHGDEVSPAIYLHWGGGDVAEYLARCHARMLGRFGDVGYTAARFIGIAHQDIDGNTSLGTWNEGDLATIRTPKYSHGDAGVFIVHLTPAGQPWQVEEHGGYGITANGTKPWPVCLVPYAAAVAP